MFTNNLTKVLVHLIDAVVTIVELLVKTPW
jgi:hypothetical protein